jgi:hypothetical protein
MIPKSLRAYSMLSLRRKSVFEIMVLSGSVQRGSGDV